MPIQDGTARQYCGLGRFTVEFSEAVDGSILELKLSLGRDRNLRYTKAKLPVEP
jgi:hypothetical protein